MEPSSEWIILKKGMKKKVITEGIKGKKPRFWSQVDGKVVKLAMVDSEANISDENIKYSAPLETTEEFSALRIGVATNEWLRIVETCLLFSCEGEVSEFQVKMCDGSWVAFELHLYREISKPELTPLWNVLQVMEVSKQLKESGVLLYKNKRVVDSFYLFSRAVKLLIPVEICLKKKLRETNEDANSELVHLQDVVQLVAIIYNNLAACQLSQGNFDHVLYLCNQALERSPTDLKALHRKASALFSNFLDLFPLIKRSKRFHN